MGVEPTPTGIDDRSLLARLRHRGWRVTAQRRVVAEVLEGEHVHLTADEVYHHARRLLPEVSLSTVYNTLNEMAVMGEVAEVRYGPGPSRYDPNAGRGAHHHLVCNACGAIFDVPLGTVATVELPPTNRHGFVVDNVEVVFRGTCPHCRG